MTGVRPHFLQLETACGLPLAQANGAVASWKRSNWSGPNNRHTWPRAMPLKNSWQQLRASVHRGRYSGGPSTRWIAEPLDLNRRGIDASLIPHEATNGDPRWLPGIVRSTQERWKMFAAVDAERALTIGYIKELHAALLRHQDTCVCWTSSATHREEGGEGRYKEAPDSITRPDGSTPCIVLRSRSPLKWTA